jgi:hypothetical protein
MATTHTLNSNAEVIEMFSVPLYKFSISNWKEEKKLILEALPEEKLATDIYTDFWENSNERKLPSYSDLVLDIVSPAIETLQSTLDRGPDGNLLTHQCWMGLDNMWYQTEHRGQKHDLHNHGFIGWSSVLYVNYNPKVHTATKFLSPTGCGAGTGGLIQWYQPDVKEGDFIIFDSNIMHQALPNESDEKRTIISMNFQTSPMIPIKQYQTK